MRSDESLMSKLRDGLLPCYRKVAHLKRQYCQFDYVVSVFGCKFYLAIERTQPLKRLLQVERVFVASLSTEGLIAGIVVRSWSSN